MDHPPASAPLADYEIVVSEETWDFVVIGSGFGGSVSALRLSEKGYRVLVLERGRRFGADDFPRSNWNLRRYLWAPRLGLRGIMKLICGT
jgi:cholesterol oxidase